MKDTFFAYTFANIKCLENKLLKKSDFETALSLKSHDECVSYFKNKGALSDDFFEDEDIQIFNVYKTIKQMSPDKNLLDFLVVKNDFYNIRALLYKLVFNKDTEYNFSNVCVNQKEILCLAFEKREFEILSPPFCDICKIAYEIALFSQDISKTELFLDKAYVTSLLYLSKKTNDEHCIRAGKLMAFLFEVKKAYLICKNKNINFDFDDDIFYYDIDGYDIYELKKSTRQGAERVAHLLKKNGFEKVSKAFLMDENTFEIECDNELMTYFKKAIFCTFSSFVPVAYFYALLCERNNLRVVLYGKMGGISSEIIKERLCETYV